jgi:hypothetical protein
MTQWFSRSDAITQDTLCDIDKQWLEYILEAIGDNGNVTIDPCVARRRVSIIAVDPRTGRAMQWQDNVQDGKLATELPGLEKDLALHIVLVSAEANL